MRVRVVVRIDPWVRCACEDSCVWGAEERGASGYVGCTLAVAAVGCCVALSLLVCLLACSTATRDAVASCDTDCVGGCIELARTTS